MELHEYLKIARKLVCKYGPSLVRDEDAIAYVADYIIKADLKYNSNIGSIEGFRYASARYAIKNWINRNIKNKRKTISINAGECSLEDKIDSKDSTLANVETNEILDFIDTLKESEQKAIKMYFFESKSFKEIGQALNITREGVRQKIKRTLQKIREKFE